jgi:hypothetical protein
VTLRRSGATTVVVNNTYSPLTIRPMAADRIFVNQTRRAWIHVNSGAGDHDEVTAGDVGIEGIAPG